MKFYRRIKNMKQTGSYHGCSERYRAYHEARKDFEAAHTALEKLNGALAAMEDAPSSSTHIEAAIKRAIKRVEDAEPVLRAQLRTAEQAYFGR